jgi:hypothetical protein
LVVPTLQQVSPASHSGSQVRASQLPAVQIWPGSQALPQPPQCCVDERVSVHTSSQQVWVEEQIMPPHVSTHSPMRQVWPSVQALLQ